MESEQPHEDRDALNMIVVMGVTGAGKSHFINTIAGRQVSKEGHTLDPCTSQCQAVGVNIGSSKVVIIDTPGFDDSARSDSEILEEISEVLTFQYRRGVKLRGVIYLHRITDVRYAKSAVKTFEIFQKIVGERALKNVLLVTTRWSEVKESQGADRERELRSKFWSYMLSKNSTLARFHDTRESAVSLASILVNKSSIILEIQHEIVDEGKTLQQTAAGGYVNEDLQKLKTQHEESLEEIKNLKARLASNDVEMHEIADQDLSTHQDQISQDKRDEALLRKRIDEEVRARLEAEKKKKGKKGIIRKTLPFVPSVLSMLGLFVRISPGTLDTFTSWLQNTDLGESVTEFFDN